MRPLQNVFFPLRSSTGRSDPFLPCLRRVLFPLPPREKETFLLPSPLAGEGEGEGGGTGIFKGLYYKQCGVLGHPIFLETVMNGVQVDRPSENSRKRDSDAPVAQWIEHQTSDLRVGGSTPSGRAMKEGSRLFRAKGNGSSVSRVRHFGLGSQAFISLSGFFRPILCILVVKVVGGIPSNAAAPLSPKIFQFARCKALKMFSRSNCFTSSNVRT